MQIKPKIDPIGCPAAESVPGPGRRMTAPPARMLPVFQGDFRISDDPDICLTTVLGSCVAACLHDPVRRIGGVNHFLLPNGSGRTRDALRYGVNAMELLINALLRAGAARERLQAKLFGGAQMFGDDNGIGRANAAFAEEFLAVEGIPVVSASLLGKQARKIRFWPVTGRAQQLLVPNSDLPGPRPSATGAVDAPETPRAQDVELF